MDKQQLIAAINEYITSNGVQEITGQVMNLILTSIANIIPDDTKLTSSYGGVVNPNETISVTPGIGRWFIASAGVYTNNGGFTFLPKNLNILSYDGINWEKSEITFPFKSIDDIQKTSTIGLIDTYTITFTDGSAPKTFEVTNGADGGGVSPTFDPTTETEAQGGKQINEWLSQEVQGGQSSGITGTIEEVGNFYKNIGATQVGTSNDGLIAGLYQIKGNSNSIADADKYLTKGFINLFAAGNFKFCIGSWNGTKFNIRWESDEKNGVIGLNTFDFTNDKIKIYNGEMAAILCLPSTTAKIKFGTSGGSDSTNRFSQYSTTSGFAQGNAGSYYSVYFELKDINTVTTSTDGFFNLEKSVAKINESLIANNGYIGQEYLEGDSATVTSDSTVTEGYAINKIDIPVKSLVSKLEIKVVTAGAYNFVFGFIEQSGKFIEKNIITKTLIVGVNVVTFDPIVLDVGDYVGLKFPSKLPVNDAPTVDYLWISTSYTSSLTKVAGKSLPIKLFLGEFIESVFAPKSDLITIENSVSQFEQNFIHNGVKVKLIFNPDNTVTWNYPSGYTKILHLGNSILRHAIVSYWWGDWGMAAKTREGDYAHRFLAKIKTLNPTALSWEQNIAAWEVAPTTYNKALLDPILTAQPYDLIVVRLGENATGTAAATYKNEFRELIEYIETKAPTARIIIGGMFWINAGLDNAMEEIAIEKNLTFVDMSGLDIPANKSFIGDIVQGDDGQSHTVNNSGVANHPNNAGMEGIATRLFNAI